MYHSNCLCSLYNRAGQDTTEDNDDSYLHGITFAELVAFLEDMRSDEESAPMFKRPVDHQSRVSQNTRNS